MTPPLFMEEIHPNGSAWITLTRPDVHNAFDDVLINHLTRTLASLREDSRVRVLVLAARGRSFSAGADLNWMKAMAGKSQEENRKDAQALAEMLHALAAFPKPTLAVVQGPAYGGGVGLVACCDIAIAAEEANFALTEVKLGLIPAVVSPYVVAAIGGRAARRYFLTGERFSAWEAHRLGLVHEVTDGPDLEQRVRIVVDRLLTGGPEAQSEAKQLVAAVLGRPLDGTLIAETAERIAAIRVSEEGREGIAAFLEKRKPRWVAD